MKINEIQVLVNGIVSKGHPIPGNLLAILKDVISQRRDASAFYRPRGQIESDRGHAYYITVLEWAVKTLEQASPSFRPKGVAQSSSDIKSRTDVGLSNLFDMLEIEGFTSRSGDGASSESESESMAKKKYQNITKTCKKKSKSSTEASKQVQGSAGKKGRDPDLDFLDSIIREQPVLEEEDDEDYFFIIFCFFKDWNYIREYLQERWCKSMGFSFYPVFNQV